MNNHKKQAGYTIIELIVAIVMIGILAGTVTGFIVGIQNIQKKANYKESATRAAASQMESLRNAKYNNLVNGSNIDFSGDLPANLPGNKTGTASVSEPMTGLKRVDIVVSYTDGGKTEQVKLSSLIGQIGLSK